MPNNNYEKKLRFTGFFFIFPVTLYFLILYWVPLLSTLKMSLFSTSTKVDKFVGLETYGNVLSDEYFWNAFSNTIIFSVISVVAIILIGLVISISLYSLNKRLRNAFVLLIIIPTFVSFTAAGLIWSLIYNPDFGFANYILEFITNEPKTFLFLQSEQQVIPFLAIINIWVRLGLAIIIFMAGLENIPDTYIETAKVNGAKGLKLHRYITLPMLVPHIVVVLLLEVINSIKVFDIVIVAMKGEPNDSSQTLMTYYYKYFKNFDNSPEKAAVVAVCIFILLLLFGIIHNKIRERVKYEL